MPIEGLTQRATVLAIATLEYFFDWADMRGAGSQWR